MARPLLWKLQPHGSSLTAALDTGMGVPAISQEGQPGMAANCPCPCQRPRGAGQPRRGAVCCGPSAAPPGQAAGPPRTPSLLNGAVASTLGLSSPPVAGAQLGLPLHSSRWRVTSVVVGSQPSLGETCRHGDRVNAPPGIRGHVRRPALRVWTLVSPPPDPRASHSPGCAPAPEKIP